MEIAVVGATAVVTVTDGTVTDARVAMTALSRDDQARTRSRSCPGRQRRRRGSRRGGGAAVAAAATPISDVRGSAEYRRAMAAVIAGRAIETALSRARTGGGRMKVAATLNVNGVAYPVELDPGTNLLAAVRDVVGLTGSKEGCDDSECGACMMLLDGQPVNACSYLALQAEGSEITTVEGLADGDTLAPAAVGVSRAGRCPVRLLHSRDAHLRDGTPRRRTRAPTEDEVRIGLSGNLCRCTGYDGIVKAVLSVAGGP